jgi:formate hydrogenlyase subunit 3/multisubunit Na+/H+ antiporter MnhD subunit
MEEIKRWFKLTGSVFIVALASSVIFCFGCTMHETHRWGQSQDFVTHLLALGAYFSFGLALVGAVGFVLAIIASFTRRTKSR